ncbi:hypothetical protein DTO217A2_1947 [Paecilomyces variotii]|nr:hypothetical protein DTO217A2_1947 [Paecilomyces variotii]KAJ9373209.1 hypothetical protein DTO282E5_2276 [Paecilomyces variotii]KAJ9394459.1 hypothetical protein DTO282F9_8635 [Paecilomyces variotii]
MVNFKGAAFAAIAVLTSVSYALNTTLPAPVLVNLDTMGSGPSETVVGGLYRPNKIGPRAVFVMHSESDYIDFSVCTQLAERGYTVFCADDGCSKWTGASDVAFEQMMLSVATGVDYLRNLTEISKVVLWGHSGGGAMMSAYQNIAENGLVACNGTEKIYPCTSALADLPAADGVMLIDANYGLSTMVLVSLGAEIINERSGLHVDYNLSVYNPANGFNASGASHYTPEFTKAFQFAVARRMQRLIAYAEGRLAAINAGNATFSDDEDMQIVDAAYGVQNNKFFAQDPRFLSRTVYPWPLLHKNGSTTREIVHSVRVPTNFGPTEAGSYLNGAIKTSVKRFLNGYAIRVTDDFSYNETSFTGIQWNSSHMVPIQAVPGIKVPLLTMGMTGHWEYLNAEKIYLNSGSNDTTICFVEGAQHTIDTCTECETYPGEYGDTTKTAYDYMANWLGKEGRFL